MTNINYAKIFHIGGFIILFCVHLEKLMAFQVCLRIIYRTNKIMWLVTKLNTFNRSIRTDEIWASKVEYFYLHRMRCSILNKLIACVNLHCFLTNLFVMSVQFESELSWKNNSSSNITGERKEKFHWLIFLYKWRLWDGTFFTYTHVCAFGHKFSYMKLAVIEIVTRKKTWQSRSRKLCTTERFRICLVQIHEPNWIF